MLKHKLHLTIHILIIEYLNVFCVEHNSNDNWRKPKTYNKILIFAADDDLQIFLYN